LTIKTAFSIVVYEIGSRGGKLRARPTERNIRKAVNGGKPDDINATLLLPNLLFFFLSLSHSLLPFPPPLPLLLTLKFIMILLLCDRSISVF